MKWASSGQLLAVSIGFLSCRLLIEWLARFEQLAWAATEPALAMALDAGVFFFAILAFIKLRIARAAKAIQAERQRIAQDLHDGLGFHLMVALSLSRDRTEIPADVRMALELAIVELHSVVHFVHSQSVPIADAMASLRYRLQPVIDRKGLQLAWHVDENIPPDVLVGTAAYHFMKVLQEALSNVLQHAHADRLEVRLTHRRRELLLEVVDNGQGLDAASRRRGAASLGRGLAGMYRRAELMRSKLEITEPPGGGTCIRLAVRLPCRSD
jgi:signal transduction histidine kinase